MAAESRSSSSYILVEQEVEITTVDVLAAKDLIYTDNYRFLDVRTEEEFKKGHVDSENTLNIPYMFQTPEGRVKNPKFMEQVLSVCNKDDQLVVSCNLGGRGSRATADLLRADFKQVCNLGGGFSAWSKNNLPVTKPEDEL